MPSSFCVLRGLDLATHPNDEIRDGKQDQPTYREV
jgi:hypothetical protein